MFFWADCSSEIGIPTRILFVLREGKKKKERGIPQQEAFTEKGRKNDKK